MFIYNIIIYTNYLDILLFVLSLILYRNLCLIQVSINFPIHYTHIDNLLTKQHIIQEVHLHNANFKIKI